VPRLWDILQGFQLSFIQVFQYELSTAAELGTLLGELGLNVQFDELDLVTAREAKPAALVLLVLVVVVSLAAILGLVVVLAVTLVALIRTILLFIVAFAVLLRIMLILVVILVVLLGLIVVLLVTLATLLPTVTSPLRLRLTTLTSIDSNPDVILELGITRDLLNRDVALILLAVLVELEVLLALDALFLVGVEAEEGNLVGVLVPVLVDDVEALLLAVSATGANIGGNPVVVSLRALQILADASRVGGLGVVVDVLLAFLLVFGASSLVSLAIATLMLRPALGAVGARVTTFNVPFELLALITIAFAAVSLRGIVFVAVMFLASLLGKIVIAVLLWGVVVVLVSNTGRGCDGTGGNEGQDSGNLMKLHD
jgi:hypothetical protein